MRITNDWAVLTARISDQATAASMRLTRESLALTRQSNEHAYRAWLIAKEPAKDKQGRHGFFITAGSKPRLTARFENVGKSPAQNISVVVRTAIERLDWVITDEYLPKPPPHARRPHAVIGPGQVQELDFRREAVVAPAEEQAIKEGRLAIWFVALVTYADQFSANRETRFCLYHFGDYRDIGSENLSLWFCGDQNARWNTVR